MAKQYLAVRSPLIANNYRYERMVIPVRNGIVKFAASLLVIAAFAAVPAQAQKNVKKVVVPKPKCVIGQVAYDDQTTLVAVKSGLCFVPKYKGHKLQKLPVNWSFAWTGYAQDGTTFGDGSKGAGNGTSFPLNPTRFYTVKATFTITSPKAGKRPKVSASRTQTIQTDGNGLIGPALNSGPGTTPPPTVNGVNPLCPFTDPYADKFGSCGTAVSGSGAFVTPPTMDPDGTVHSGTWLAPGGQCVAPPTVARGPYNWFGYNIFFVTGYLCGDGSIVGAFGVTTISLVNADGSSCTLHPDGVGVVSTFRLRPEWGGIAKVTFSGFTVNRSNGNPWPGEYETAQFKLNGGQNGCTSPDWKIESIQ